MSQPAEPAPRRPPGPRGLPLIGSTLDVQRDALSFYLHITRQFGDLVGYHFIFWPSVILNHPDYVRHMLQENNHNYSKETFNYRMLTWFIGNGLLTSGGEFWLRQRRLIQPAFHRQRITMLDGLMSSAAVTVLDRLAVAASANRPVDIAEEMMRVTLAIVSKALFSLDISDVTDTIGHSFAAINAHYANYVATLVFPPQIPLPRNRRFRAVRERLDRFVFDTIEERRRTKADIGDVLSMLLQAIDEETDARMNDAQVRDEVMTLLFAGHETAANALAWTWYLLWQNPAAEVKLHAELDQVLQGRAPTMADLPHLPYTRMVLDETLRLYPPVWIIPRRAIGDDEIGGYRIPKDTIVHLCPYVLHRNPQFWDAPERFEPERFTAERSAARPRFAYCPFGGGPRLCIGSSFALTEIHLVLATIAQRYRLGMPSGHVVDPVPQVTLQPRHGMLMTVEARNAADS